MADRRRTNPSGTGGGTDVEPLRGGMAEIKRGEDRPASKRRSYAGQENERETAEKKEPPSPYHDVRVSEGGLTPRATPGVGPTPSRQRGELEATAGEKIQQERGSLENEGGNAPRQDPSSR